MVRSPLAPPSKSRSPNLTSAYPARTSAVACDSYHRYEEDAQMMADMGLKHYRFSVAWPRIVPTGQIADGVNEAGLQYYDNLIDALLARGITPYITLYHWDLPQALLNSANGTYGWYSTDARGQPDGQIIPHFVDFADLCFARYGDRVKTWCGPVGEPQLPRCCLSPPSFPASSPQLPPVLFKKRSPPPPSLPPLSFANAAAPMQGSRSTRRGLFYTWAAVMAKPRVRRSTGT